MELNRKHLRFRKRFCARIRPLCLFVLHWVTKVIIGSEKTKAIDHQIKRFERSARRRLRKLAGLSPRLGDLVLSFPGAAYAIATDSVEPNRTGEAVRRVKEGYGLREVVQPLGLPMWLKRVPPEAFSGKLAGLPDGEKFARQIAGRIPQNPAYASCWLNWVSFAGQAADDEFALWIAGQKPPFVRTVPVNRVPLRPLAVYAWYSRHADGPARQLIDKPWQPSMRFETATWAMQHWLDRVARLFKPQRPRRGPGRYSRRQKAGLRMVALRTRQQLREEGRAMNHCVGDYANAVAAGDCLIFSIRNGDKRLATLEIRCTMRRNVYSIIQLQGPGNTRASEEVWDFTRRWVDRYSVDPAGALGSEDEEFTVKADQWEQLWKPYMAAKGCVGFEANSANLEKLLAEAELLRQCA